MATDLILIGYSGHAYVCIENALLNKFKITGYCDREEKTFNPYALNYLGTEREYFATHTPRLVFIGIGNNILREKIIQSTVGTQYVNLIHPQSTISQNVSIEEDANILINAGVVVNPLAKIGKGVILNTSCIVEHECEIEEYAHIAPGAVLAGNVKIGARTFVGANAAIKQGIVVGNDVIIGAGSVVLNDVPDGIIIVGNPAKKIIR